MLKRIALPATFVMAAITALASSERRLDFSDYPLDETPPGFRSAASVTGKPGEWKIVLDDAPTFFTPLSPNAPAAKRPVLAQVAQDRTDEHYPVLIFDEETYGDFTLTTRLKNVRGEVAQMAGIAFRLQDENNYYIVRASSLGNTLRFYKFVNGQRSPAIGPDIEIPSGVWHELTIECRGNQIRCFFNGKEAMPALNDSSFLSGKIGFWTKSDSVSHFADTRITYTPRESQAQRIINGVMERQPRLLGLKIFALNEDKPDEVRIVASSNPEEIGQSGGATERNVIAEDSIYYQRHRSSSLSVTLPLQDRNGDTVAAVGVTLKAFPGQTQNNAIARALPIIQELRRHIHSARDLAR